MEGMTTVIARCNIQGMVRVCKFTRERNELDWTMTLFGNSANWTVVFKSNDVFKVARWNEDTPDTEGVVSRVFL